MLGILGDRYCHVIPCDFHGKFKCSFASMYEGMMQLSPLNIPLDHEVITFSSKGTFCFYV